MSGSSDDDIFITQTKTCEMDDYNLETDTVLSDALNLEENYVKEAIQLPNFDLKYSDISDVETPNLPENAKTSLSIKTENKTRWAVNLFSMWKKHRNNNNSEEKGLFNLSSQELNEALSFFIAEVRKESGDNYKPNTLYEIIISIQDYLRQNGRLIAYMDDQEYQGSRSVLNSKMKELSRLGLGINTKKSEVITIEQEEILWSKGLLG
ncbi:hypothetical protein LOTGIDRAFT_163121 [Lottia gigantea]|uniref:QRICH1-like domain-containing protein n=1 Tax=Lottia gigantea TaxID=225164 RepID=V3ZKC1_LOTGI|nr:hypothetical protein LOTGIDRAFT_163121 [Lottia gigantea]ESO91763.1 hypothetical protein LOTGIDRAFT_163121 [Lottia gigantea]